MAPARNSSLRSVAPNRLTTYDLLHGLLKESIFAGRKISSETSKGSRSKLLNDALRSDGCDMTNTKKDKIKTGLDEQTGRTKPKHHEQEIFDDVRSEKAKRLVNLIHELLRYATTMTMRKQQSQRQRLDAKVKKESSKIECLYNNNYNNPLLSLRLSAENVRKIKRPVEKPRSQIEIPRKYSDREKGGGCSNAEQNSDRPVSEQKRRVKSSGKPCIEQSAEEIIRPSSRKRPRSTFEEPCREKMSNKYNAKERIEDYHISDNVPRYAEPTNTIFSKVSASCKKESGTEFKVRGDRDTGHASRRTIHRKKDCAEGPCNCCYRCECPKSDRKNQDEDEEIRSFGDEIDREEREFLEMEEKRRKSEKNKSPEKEIPSERRPSEKKRKISSEKRLTPESKVPLKKSERTPYDDRASPEHKIPSERRKSPERRTSQEKRKSPKRKISTPTKQLSDENISLEKRSDELNGRQERRRSSEKRRSPRRSFSKDDNDESRKDSRRKYDSECVPEDKRRGSRETSKEKHKKAKPNDGYISEDITENKKSKKEKERFDSDLSKRRKIISDEFDEEQSQYGDDLDKNYADEWDSVRPVKPKEEPRVHRLSPDDFGSRVYHHEREAEEKAWKSSKLSTIDEEQKSNTKRKQSNHGTKSYKSQMKSGEHKRSRDESCPFITHEKSLISSSYIDICNQYADTVADACVTEYDDAIHQICREFLEHALPGISFDYDSTSEEYHNYTGNLNSLFGQRQCYPIFNSAL